MRYILVYVKLNSYKRKKVVVKANSLEELNNAISSHNRHNKDDFLLDILPLYERRKKRK